RVKADLRRLDDVLIGVPNENKTIEPSPLDRNKPTAVIAVSTFSGFGLHQVLSIHKTFPNHFRQFIFVSVAVVDSGVFKGAEEIDKLTAATESALKRYVCWVQAHGLAADYRMR